MATQCRRQLVTHIYCSVMHPACSAAAAVIDLQVHTAPTISGL